MNSFQILLAFACLIAAISASPVKKNVQILKNAKSAKYLTHASHNTHHHSIEEILEELPYHSTEIHVHHAEDASFETPLAHSSIEIEAEVVHDHHHHHVPEASIETVDVEVIPEEEEIIVHEIVNVEGVGEIPIDVEIKIDEKTEEAFHHHHQEAPQQHGSFFNSHFGQTNGAVIAVGNSYSTGANGHSESRAEAHHGAQHHII